MSITIPPPFHLRQATAAPSASTSFAACTWAGHCLGDSCASNDDCDNDWICVNRVCSPCCETQSTTTSTSAATSQGKSDKGLDTAAAIGIGVGIVAFLILCVAAGFWIWLRRRKRSAANEAANAHGPGSNPYGTGSFPTDSDRKRLFETTGSSRAELPCSSQPAELSTVELVELDASSRPHTQKYPVPPPDQVATPTAPRYRFEEYVPAGNHVPGQWTYAPVIDDTQSYTSPRSTTFTAAPQQQAWDTAPARLQHASPASSQTSSFRSRQMYAANPTDPSISSRSTTLVPSSASPAPTGSSLGPPKAGPPRHHPSDRSHLSYRGRGGLEDDTGFVAGDDPNEPYTLFRWPSASPSTSRYSPR
ncbi:hypothetical protein BU26DRAFT_50971 [Trematosphaeria pertusa]|uniref:Membrane anchor Opy2 N-terminal domain-containing protein n=1 Tax=Trematosphaeria pertusa TaxID=390896 RepID=A0A6A6I9B3_9PLEO|nr:uncharacterized protein BU26DRAFT_50971 [Trematosphaeria pertusa]KAF2246668.1 hypothetical protein BU26DRAFT_50971 [Trematosphaeria pertusa]